LIQINRWSNYSLFEALRSNEFCRSFRGGVGNARSMQVRKNTYAFPEGAHLIPSRQFGSTIGNSLALRTFKDAQPVVDLRTTLLTDV